MSELPWHDDDDFWRIYDPVLFGEEQHLAASAEVEAVLDLSGVTRGAAALDLCCGPGRHALELARRGLEVTGVDRTERYLLRARAEAEAEGLELDLVQADVRSFCRPGAFELVINLYTSFGYFDDPADDLRVARNMAECLRPGGTLVMEMVGKEVIARVFQERDWHRISGGGFMLEERRLIDGWSRIANTWTLVAADGAITERAVTLRLYSGAELRALLLEAGFGEVKLFGDLRAAPPYDNQAQRLVALARR